MTGSLGPIYLQSENCCISSIKTDLPSSFLTFLFGVLLAAADDEDDAVADAGPGLPRFKRVHWLHELASA